MNLEPEQRRFVDIASKSGATLLSLIEDILDMSRIESGQLVLTRAPLSLGDLTAEVVDLFSASAREKRLSLHSASAEQLPAFVLGDRTRIRQVLINLVANAIKFTNAGSVTIDVKRLEKQDVYRLSVADTGMGIAATEAQRVFEPFVQLDSGFSRRQEGTGLGLAISKRLVEAMGGSIGYESTPGGGSRFWFELELAAAQGPDKTAPMNLSAGKTRTRDGKDSTAPYRVLVAEDSPANRAVLCAYLQADGLEVDTAQNGQEVLDAVAESDYDIILMDVSMPGMDGLEAARRLRSLPGQARSIPIVALTAHAFEHTREQCLAARGWTRS